jgi:hypothetical protein
MKRLNFKALFANLIISVVLAGMLATSLAAQGLAPMTANIAALMLCIGLLIAPIVMTKVSIQLKNKKTGKVVNAHIDSLAFVKLLVARMLTPHGAGINKEIWEDHILGNLFPDNSFLEGMLDESEYVNNLTVHSPQAGAVGATLVDPVFPLNGGAGLNVTQRSDTTVDWTIHYFFNGPILINNAEMVQLSYNKRESVLYEMEMDLRRVITENLIVYCAPTGAATLPANLGGGTNKNVFLTSGVVNNDPTNIQALPTYVAGATGNRLVYGLYDIANMKTFFDNQNIPDEDRYCLMTANAERQLINDMIATKYRASLGDVFDLKTGMVSNIMGFKLYKRSFVMLYNNNTLAVKPWGAASAANDSDAMLFWQKAGMAKAFGDINIFEQIGSPRDGGDIYSVAIRMGSTKKRYSELGVAVLVQGPSA